MLSLNAILVKKDGIFFMGKYKKFNQTEPKSIVITSRVKIAWNHKHMRRYVDMGYKYTGRGDYFECAVNDLPRNSKAKIQIECPVCHENRIINYCDFITIGHTLCRRCSHANDLRGVRFGRLIATDMDWNKTESGVYWNCVCDCGEKTSVRQDGLINGSVLSCGCYFIEEIVRKNTGDRNPNWKNKNVLTCTHCGKEYTTSPHRESVSKFCSQSCFYKYNIGEKNAAWNPQLTDLDRESGRNYPEYKTYIKNILARDKGTCSACYTRTKHIEVHHLYHYSSYPEYRTDEKYGIAVCSQCHAEFHRWMGGTDKSCVPADFDRWLYATS